MKIVWPIGSCRILEFGRPNDHRISTLLFAISPYLSMVDGERILYRFIKNGITPYGQWDLAATDKVKLEDAVFCLMPHKSWHPATRSRRLFERARWLKNVSLSLGGDLPMAA